MRHHVGRRELVLDELDERLLHREVVAALDVIVVEQDHEQPDVGPRRFPLLVVVVANRRGGPLSIGLERIELHDRERVDLLRLAVLGDGEIVLREIHHRLAVLVGDDDVDADVVDAACG